MKKIKEWVRFSNDFVKFIFISVPTILLFIYNPFKNEEIASSNKIEEKKITSIFSLDDTENFNILIVRFEDIINNDETNCIGSSIQDKIGVIDANEGQNINIVAHYADSISAPKSLREAKRIQKSHNADLIIYGIADNLVDCKNADICFRYNIKEDLVSNKTPEFDIKRSIHDSKTLLTSPEQIEKGNFEISELSINKWIVLLAELKINKANISFSELENILIDSDTLSAERLSKIYLSIGKTCKSLNQFECAIKAYTKAIDLNPKNSCFYNYRGIAYKNSKNYKKAISDYSQAIRLDAKYADAYYNRGAAFERSRKFDSAIIDFKKAINIRSSDEDYYIYLGYVYSVMNDHNSAIEPLNTAISINPKDTLAYTNRGVAYRGLGEKQKALDDFNLALTLDSTSYHAYNSRGILYKNDHMYELALDDYNKAIKLARIQDTYAYFNRGNLYAIQNQNHLAVKDFNKYISFEPSDFEGFYFRGIALSKLEKYQLALEDFKMVAKLNDTFAKPSIYLRKAISYNKLKNYPRAIKNFNSIIFKDSSRSTIYHGRGLTYKKMGLHSKALKDLNKAITLNESYTNAYNSRGVVYLKINLDNAIKDFKKVISLDSTFFHAYVNLFYALVVLKYWYVILILVFLIVVVIKRKKLRRVFIKMK